MTDDRDGGGGGSGGNGDCCVNSAMDRQEIRLLQSQILHLFRKFSNLREEVCRGAYSNCAAASPVMLLVSSVPAVKEEEKVVGDSNRAQAILMSHLKTCHDL